MAAQQAGETGGAGPNSGSTSPSEAQPPVVPVPVEVPIQTESAEPAEKEKSESDELPLIIHGTIDMYGMGNFNSPSNGSNGLRVFDAVNAGGLQLNLAKLSVEMLPSPIGFRLDLSAGLAITGPAGLGVADPSRNTHPTHAAWHRHIQQAYLSFLIPIGKGLRLDAGKFVTHMGYEVIETRDNWNYSRGILFGFAIPFYHTGLRASYPITDQLNMSLFWLNGWNTFVHEGSQMMTGGLQLAFNASDRGQLIFNYIGGRFALNSSQRHVFDLIGVYKATDQLSLALNFDVGHDNVGAGALYWGVAAYGRYQHLPWFAQALRFEFFHDKDQFWLATAGLDKAWEITATIVELAKKIGPAEMLIRLEYRHDQGNIPIFITDNAAVTSTHQDTVTLGTVAYF